MKTLYIEPGSPCENGYIESFNGKLQDELLARELFDTLLEAEGLIERWRKAYNTERPHRSLGYRPPAPESRRPWQRYPDDRNWFPSIGAGDKLKPKLGRAWGWHGQKMGIRSEGIPIADLPP